MTLRCDANLSSKYEGLTPSKLKSLNGSFIVFFFFHVLLLNIIDVFVTDLVYKQ